MSHLNQAPRSIAKIPSFNSKIPSVRTPGINTFYTSRFMSTNNSAKSVSSSINRSDIPTVRPTATPTTKIPSSKGFNLARTAPNPVSSQARSCLIPKTHSTFQPNTRLTASSKIKKSFSEKKKSKAVDFAKVIKRRSIQIKINRQVD
ncbi:unnamed protein product [Brachionus calyciflorus]|uniref:Uncharacterized protein n=1 Tax=Brachionus calyciflorus TaxID=104777 RepID=A0A814LLB2_9BILA|nr:unnamed protein product [Brachionus calyciflorus]